MDERIANVNGRNLALAVNRNERVGWGGNFAAARWMIAPIDDEAHMKRINLYSLHYLGLALGALKDKLDSLKAGETKLSAIRLHAYRARFTLAALDSADYEPPLPMCKKEANNIIATIDDLLKTQDTNTDDPTLDSFDLWSLSNKLERFDNILSAELPQAETYIIPDKRAYKVPALLAAAEVALSGDATKSLDKSVIYDLREAGRCVALEIPNGAGFHIFRAVEAVVLMYFPAIGLSAPKIRNLGRYIKMLVKNGVNPKIIGMLEHLKDHHRNPIIHPDVALTPDEALDLFGFAMSAINAMIRDIQAERDKRAAPILPMPGLIPSPQASAVANLLLGGGKR